jgi:hypothetical protein
MKAGFEPSRIDASPPVGMPGFEGLLPHAAIATAAAVETKRELSHCPTTRLSIWRVLDME